MTGFSSEWDTIYKNNQQLTMWPWSDLVSLIHRFCADAIRINGSVLELGCGVGPNIPLINSLGMNYYGIEGSKNVVSKLHNRFPTLDQHVKVGDFTNKSCFTNIPKVDVIIDRASVTHNNELSIRETLKNCNEALNPGGHFIGIDWFSTKHSDYLLGNDGDDIYTRENFNRGQFQNVGNVHFSDELHLRSLFYSFDIISLDEKVINIFEPNNNHQFASWNIVAKKK